MANTHKIFISYSRQDAEASLSIRNDLASAFGEASVFRDWEGLKIGNKWYKILLNHVKSSKCVVLVIGPSWKKDELANKLLKSNDVLRNEIITAYKYDVPVLVVNYFGSKMNNRVLKDPVLYQILHEGQWREYDEKNRDRVIKEIGEIINQEPYKKERFKIEHCILNLDRGAAYGKFIAESTAGKYLFIGYGSLKSGFSQFVKRCREEEITFNKGTKAPEIVSIDWEMFLTAVRQSPENATNVLCREIAKKLSIKLPENKSARSFSMDYSVHVKKFLLLEQQSYLFWTQAKANQVNPVLRNLWIDTWKELIPKSRQDSRKVFLFISDGWFGRFGRKRIDTTGNKTFAEITEFGKINKNHINTWLENNEFDSQFRRRMKKIHKWMSSVHFQTVYEEAFDEQVTGRENHNE